MWLKKMNDCNFQLYGKQIIGKTDVWDQFFETPVCCGAQRNSYRPDIDAFRYYASGGSSNLFYHNCIENKKEECSIYLILKRRIVNLNPIK